MRLLFEAQSIMERDALVARLQDAGIECHAEHRDLSRRITNNTIDLSYDAVSVVQAGFKLSVLEEDFESAQKVLLEFRKQMDEPALKIATPINHFDRFYKASLFSVLLLTLPITLPLVTYHLTMAVRSREKIPLIKLSIALTVFIASLMFICLYFYHQYK